MINTYIQSKIRDFSQFDKESLQKAATNIIFNSKLLNAFSLRSEIRQKIQISQVSLSREIDKQAVVFSYSGTLFSSK